MAVLDTITFRLRPDVGGDAFVALDARVQEDFAYRQPGLLRRTTAKSDTGGWLVVHLWQSLADADRADGQWSTSPFAADMSALVEPGSVRTERYVTLD